MRPILVTQPDPPIPSSPPYALGFGLTSPAFGAGPLVALLSNQKPFFLRGRHTLFHEGDDAESVFLLLSGSLRMFRFMANGQRLVSMIAFPGDIVGLSFANTYPLTAEAIKSAVVCRISRSKLALLCDHSSSLRDDIITMLKHELHTTQLELLPMMHQNAEQRIARLLMLIARRECIDLKRGAEIQISMTRTDIADFIGLTVETVCRGFTKLKSDHLISACASDVIRVDDAQRLIALAESEH